MDKLIHDLYKILSKLEEQNKKWINSTILFKFLKIFDYPVTLKLFLNEFPLL